MVVTNLRAAKGIVKVAVKITKEVKVVAALVVMVAPHRVVTDQANRRAEVIKGAAAVVEEEEEVVEEEDMTAVALLVIGTEDLQTDKVATRLIVATVAIEGDVVVILE